jgi:hypothetical protein
VLWKGKQYLLCSTSGPHSVTLVENPLISYEWLWLQLRRSCQDHKSKWYFRTNNVCEILQRNSALRLDLNIFLLMNYILHFFFTIQYNIGFRNKRNAYINPFPTSALRLDQAKHVSNTNSTRNEGELRCSGRVRGTCSAPLVAPIVLLLLKIGW